MVKELRIVLDNSDYNLLREKKDAAKITWREVLFRAFDLEPAEE